MLKFLKLFEVCMKKFSDKEVATSFESIELEQTKPTSTVELRIDDKGYIYSKHRKADKLPLDDEEFAQFCQMIGCIALMEMRDTNRVLH